MVLWRTGNAGARLSEPDGSPASYEVFQRDVTMSEEKNGRLLLIDDDEEFCLLVKDYMEL